MKKYLLFPLMLLIAFAANAQELDSLCCQHVPLHEKAMDLETALSMPNSIAADLSMQSPKITKVPEELAQLTNLQCLDLSFNRVSSFPDNFKNLENLQCLDLSGNHYLQKLPAFFNEMPNLKIVKLRDMNWSDSKKKETENEFPNITFVWQK
ncbi:leucine-rich repeat domain-containing protein [Bacteroidales bacterium OttesenSCG-928-I21]|nr:leucine-rich repeat domain-containing protein [Bacteroidales bacterium OttesenSCG-928-I21]